MTKIKSGLNFKASTTEGIFTIQTVSDKVVTYFKNDGFSHKANVNTMRVFRTSLKIAIKYFEEKHWQII